MKTQEYTVEEFAEVKSGGTPRTTNATYWDGDIGWISPKDLSGYTNIYISKGEKSITEEGLRYSSAQLLPTNTVLLSSRAPIGYVAIASRPLATNQGFKNLVCKDGVSIPEYVYYLLKNNKAKLESGATGATFKELSAGRLKRIRFNLPDVEIQKSTAEVLMAYDNLIENNQQRIALLEKAVQLLYREWFVNFRFPGHEHVKIIDGVPEGWDQTTLFECVDVLSGGTPKTTEPSFWGDEIPFFTPKDTGGNPYVYDTEKMITEAGLKKCNSRLYNKDTLFITARGTVGKVRLAQRPMAMNQSCYALQSKTFLDQSFLYFGVSERVNHLKSRAGGAVFDAIVVNTFKKIPFLLPAEDIAKDFSGVAANSLRQIDLLSFQNRYLTQARDLILPRLMEGRLEK